MGAALGQPFKSSGVELCGKAYLGEGKPWTRWCPLWVSQESFLENVVAPSCNDLEEDLTTSLNKNL